MFVTTKIATAAATGVLSLAVTGAAAFAAFPPIAASGLVTAVEQTGATAAQADRDKGDKSDKSDKGDRIKEILDRLVKAGTITQAQEDAILKAFKDAADAGKDKRDDREGAAVLKRVLADLMKLSVEYIGLPHEAVAGQLKAGKSLGEIADTQPGKSRQGLIDNDVAKVSAQLDALVAEGKITKERADAFKQGLVEHVTKFVDHKYERKPAPPKERKPAAPPAAKPTPTPTPKPTT
jgi:polyhydroxyalkanoate synthesis regulator phasin